MSSILPDTIVNALEEREPEPHSVLVLGGSGLVGSRFLEMFPYKNALLTRSRAELDITDALAVKRAITEFSPQFLINFVADTSVSRAQGERDLGEKSQAWRTNVLGVRNILEAIGGKNIHLIQFSTDLVFSGQKDDPGPYAENREPANISDLLSWYGWTKRVAERDIQEALLEKFAIVRIIYPVRSRFSRPDYLRYPLQRYREGTLYPLFTDQHMNITFIDEACRALQKVITGKHSGIFHFAASDQTTPREIIVRYIGRMTGEKPNVVNGSIITVSDKTRYPPLGGLLVAETERILGEKFSSCEAIVEELVKQVVRS